MGCNSIVSSSGSCHMICIYDVFVSFRGDTRNSFVDHLFGALQRKSILTFKDDINLRKGESIAPELLQAIEGSQIYVVVFSKNYASSTRCLRELVKILDCVQLSRKHVLPIFYDVDPSQVRKQSGDYEKAFMEYEERFKFHSEKMIEVKKWREALTQVANLSGWDIKTKPQYAEIEQIIEEILSILDKKISSPCKDIVGMQSRVKELEKLLHLDSLDDVRVVGICGMGGIGKTTLATVLYDKISLQYDSCCFIDDVSKIYKDHGSTGAQRQLLCQTLNLENHQICNHHNLALMRNRLCKLRALIILDNVDQVGQLEKLAVNREWLGAGSRIIIISRDEHILEVSGVDAVYSVPLLNHDNALDLFSRTAFKGDIITRDYEILTDEAISYANGLPLAIKVLGSFLFGRDVLEWRSALARLRENPNKDIMSVLRLSFDGLEEMEKEIFLDIACFFVCEIESYAREILDFRGFYPDIGMKVLIDRSLLACNEGWIYMHSLLRELGRSIVREKSPKEPRKWSRLWDYKDIQNVMLENKKAENLEVIWCSELNIKETMMVDALSKMSQLKLLKLEFRKEKFLGSLNYLSNKLGYLSWNNYPFKCFPPSFEPDKLVELILPRSNIKQLWKCSKPLYNLRRMDLSHSKSLVMMLDFMYIPNIESLDLEGCKKLVRINSSVGILQKLISLNLQNCRNLVCIPKYIFCLNSLEYLNLSGCPKLFNNKLLEKLRHAEQLEKLEMNKSVIRSLITSSIAKTLMLPYQFMHSPIPEDSVGLLLPSLPHFQCLYHLDLSFCNLLHIPDGIGELLFLEKLNLGGNNFVTLPCSIKKLVKLQCLNLEHCKQLKYLPDLPSRFVFPVRSKTRSTVTINFFDCPKLCEIERIYSMVFCWMIQVIKVKMQSSPHMGCINIIIPGSQIPRWFNKQNVGSTISIDPSPITYDENWIGIACCAIFVAHDDPYLKESMDTYITCGLSNEHMGNCTSLGILLRKDLVTVDKDHMALLFFGREYATNFTKGDNVFKLTTVVPPPQGFHVEVKMCGYRWVDEEDMEQLNSKMMCNKNVPVQKHKCISNDDS